MPRRLTLCLAVIWACACGYGSGKPLPLRAEISILDLRSASAATGKQAYAHALCVANARAYTTATVPGTRFSRWVCKPGPRLQGTQTFLVYVTTRDGKGRHIVLLWEAPSGDVINGGQVPRYGYLPGDVREAYAQQRASKTGLSA